MANLQVFSLNLLIYYSTPTSGSSARVLSECSQGAALADIDEATDKTLDDLSTNDFCAALLADALNQVAPLCNREASPNVFANLDECMSKKIEAHRYAPFVDATNHTLEKLKTSTSKG